MPIFQSLVDCECPLFPVDGIPSQTDHFTRSQPGIQNESILIKIVGTLGRLQKLLLLLDREEMDIVHRSDRLGISYTVHWVRVNHVVHLGRLEHGPHGDIGLADGGTGVILFHAVQNDLAMHRLYIGEPHIPHNRLDVMLIAISVIPLGVGRQSLKKLCLPKLKPLIHRHIGRGDRLSMLILVACLFQPIPRLGKRVKVVLHALSALGHKPRII